MVIFKFKNQVNCAKPKTVTVAGSVAKSSLKQCSILLNVLYQIFLELSEHVYTRFGQFRNFLEFSDHDQTFLELSEHVYNRFRQCRAFLTLFRHVQTLSIIFRYFLKHLSMFHNRFKQYRTFLKFFKHVSGLETFQHFQNYLNMSVKDFENLETFQNSLNMLGQF